MNDAPMRKALSVIVIASAGVCVYAVRQVDPDLFGYLAYGRLFLQHGGLVDADPFAYTSTGFHWVSFEYLAQVLLWVSYQHFGPAGLIALKCLVGGSAVYFLSIAVRTTTEDAIVWVPVFLLCTSTVSRYFLFRPQLFTFACFALYVAILFQFLLRRRAMLWVLPFVMLLWANTHGGFLSGLGGLSLALLLRTCGNLSTFGFDLRATLRGTRPLALTLAAAVAATWINPQGGQLWRYVLTELSHDTNRRYIAEWQPTNWGTDPWAAAALTLIVATLVGVGVMAQQHRVQIAGIPAWLWLMSCGPLIAMAYISVRHLPIAAIWSAPVITLLGSALNRSNAAAVFRRAWLATSVFALVPIVLTIQYVAGNPRPVVATSGTLLGPTNPCRVVAFMRENTLSGNAYTPLWWGSYVTWEAYPALRVSMDGRNISLFPDDMVTDNLRFYSPDVTVRDLETPLRYDTDFLLVPSDSKVLEMVRTDRRWREMYADSDSRLFVRADPAHQPILTAIARGALVPPGTSCPEVLAGPTR